MTVTFRDVGQVAAHHGTLAYYLG